MHPSSIQHRAALALTLVAGGLVAAGCRYDPDEAPRAPEPAVAGRVLLVGIDGVRADVLREVATPAFDALAAEGLLVESARTTRPTVSGPAWSSMLTGVWPDKHGVVDNEFVGERYGDFPDFLTRIERERPDRNTAAIVDWLPLVRSERGAPTIGGEIDVKHVLDGYEEGWAEADERSTRLAVELIADGDPHAVFVYLGNPDETSHEHGSIGAEYRAAIATADEQLGRIVEAVRARADHAAERWLVLVSTDHGRRPDGGHGGDSPEETTIFVLAHGAGYGSGAAPDSVRIVDVAVTALAHAGIAIRPEWSLDGMPLGGG